MATRQRTETTSECKLKLVQGSVDADEAGLTEAPTFEQREIWLEETHEQLRPTEGSVDGLEGLRRWGRQVLHGGAELSDLEDVLVEGGMEVLRRLQQEIVDEFGNGDVGPAVLCADTEGRSEEVRLGQRRERGWKHQGRFGEIDVRRLGYSATAERTLYPVSEQLNLPRRHHSYPVQKQAALLSARNPFNEVVDELRRTTANGVGKRQVEEIAVDSAVDFDAYYAEVTERLPDPEATGELVVGGIDCKGIARHKSTSEAEADRNAVDSKDPGKRRQRIKKMATVASVHTTKRHRRTPEEVTAALMDAQAPSSHPSRPRPEHRRVFASVHDESKNAVAEQLAAEMARRNPHANKDGVCLVDGERALHARIDQHLPEYFSGAYVVLDIIHVLGYLWDASHAFNAPGSDEARAWVRDRLRRILHGNVSYVVAGMKQSATKRGLDGAQRKAVDKAARYFLNNKRRMRYDEYLALGFPIASGNVEGACGHLVKDRMEITGAVWDVEQDRAEAILRLRALDKSGDFDRYWAFHMNKERERNYPRQWRAAA